MKVQALITGDLGDEECKLDFHINGTEDDIERIKNALEKAIRLIKDA